MLFSSKNLKMTVVCVSLQQNNNLFERFSFLF